MVRWGRRTRQRIVMLVDQSKAVVHTCTACVCARAKKCVLTSTLLCVERKRKPSDVVLSAKRLLEKRLVPRPESRK